MSLKNFRLRGAQVSPILVKHNNYCSSYIKKQSPVFDFSIAKENEPAFCSQKYKSGAHIYFFCRFLMLRGKKDFKYFLQ